MKQYVLALDQGTTSSRAIVFDKKGGIVSQAQKEFKQIYPKAGWVEHDPIEIWSTQIGVATEALTKRGLSWQDVNAIGITNQRETTVVWNKKTGQPIYNAIVWQDRRTADYCDEIKNQELAPAIQQKTGLVVDAYFSATKIRWILKNIPEVESLAKDGDLLFGTIDSWLVWNLTGGTHHITDVSNASRTLLFNINTLEWDSELLNMFEIPNSILPKVCASSEIYAYTSSKITGVNVPVAGIAGDQQAALFGQMCTESGMVKNTYGTGCFMLMNIGNQPKISKNKLLTTIAWKIKDEVSYALEGSIFIGGAVVQWLRDEIGIISASDKIERLAKSVSDTQGVYIVPAFTGLGAPYWNPNARGTITGITRGTNKAHIARAALESIAYQTRDVLLAMQADAGINIKELRVDGGATVNDLLMQFQADIMRCQVIRPKITEVTAIGAAYLAGLATGFYKSMEQIGHLWQLDKHFIEHSDANYDERIKGWKKAVEATQWLTKD